MAATSGERAYESLDLILETLTQESIPKERKILIKSAGKYFNGDSELNDDQIKKSLVTLIEHLSSPDLITHLFLVYILIDGRASMSF